MESKQMEKLQLDTQKPFLELKELGKNSMLTAQVEDCVHANQKTAVKLYGSLYEPCAEAMDYVSEQALNAFLTENKNVNGIGTNRNITNALIFNFPGLQGSLQNMRLVRKRLKIDSIIRSVIKTLFEGAEEFEIWNSGNFWYPKGSYMGWHTNDKTPGWRMYVNYAEEKNKSFIRYRNPFTGLIHTQWDDRMNVRLFYTTAEQPLWHAVYSNTNRFSFGYLVRPKGELKSFYEMMYTRGYKAADYSDCMQGYEWLKKNYPESYAKPFHSLRAYATKNKSLWRFARAAEDMAVLNRFKKILSGKLR